MKENLEYLLYLYESVRDDMDKLNIPYEKNVSIKINHRAKRMYGCCRKIEGKFVIEISDFLLSDLQNEIKNTIAHELIHTCYGCFNHGKRFKHYCTKLNELGYNVTTTYKGDEINQIKSNARYVVVCEKCNIKTYRMKKSKLITNPELYRCSKCRGKLQVFLLK